MPYTKEIGKSPVYVFGLRRITYDEALYKTLGKLNVPVSIDGRQIVYEDSFDAYVQEVNRWGEYEAHIRTSIYNHSR